MQQPADRPAPAASAPLPTAAESEAARILRICNACRYCEGFCAVFPAMTRRLEFNKADLHHLANLCHNCGACLHACQYAPPHEFAVNVPRSLAEVRVQTYRDYAWPPAFGRLYERAGLTTALALAGGLSLFLLLALAVGGGLSYGGGDGRFYAVFPHNLLAGLFGAAFLFALFALGMGVARFWSRVSPAALADARDRPMIGRVRAPAVAEAATAAATLRYLGGGHGEGCNEESDRFTLARRYCHHLTAYGFLLCFASTGVATLYHYLLSLEAPYALTSLPVILGVLGGVGLLVGPAGLLYLNLRRDPAHGDPAQHAMDRGFIALLLAVAATGLALLVFRETRLMPVWLAVHLGTVMAFFLTMPYGKFAHGVFRAAALLKFAIEKRLPNRLEVGD
ncbi:tricarballylate utilization 4Fe-4S protein TcuB [Azospirillum sp. TSO35-2]|uniref:tricarballylate utilization 4Fe-4S protein TcuB n=1 Tax=Azospirillum sp. TSO35-2 TaxID=716796 RepID=UPI000D61CB1C|nr:tricarballylate utilization 4Fe-4S protein TcuB [Azospirillum sp. TSO35-2]PWC39782.1 tricarballylate utilization protein B [Azospirillum sp. TSO35-2]